MMEYMYVNDPSIDIFEHPDEPRGFKGPFPRKKYYGEKPGKLLLTRWKNRGDPQEPFVEAKWVHEEYRNPERLIE